MNRTEQHVKRYGSKDAYLGTQITEFKKVEGKSSTNVKFDESVVVDTTKKP